MFIKRIIIDGFKSYANRTVIEGWDKQFNAITGLNGSGKSNVLDAICFVQGISSLSHVRAQDIKDLIYKQGQSRVQKASVTVIFDNQDRSASPIGYEEFEEISVTRQIVIGGKSKYMINGQTAQVNRVQNLFHSVSLNVNNPHFLIMQGRITKVCNMKPAELLSMIEEATGTRMYETKRAAALSTLEKKQIRMDEITHILTHEQSSTMEKLRNEKARFLKWQSLASKIERLTRVTTAHTYMALGQTVTECSNKYTAMESTINATNVSVVSCKEELQKLRYIITEEEKTMKDTSLVAMAESEQQDVRIMVDERTEKVNRVKEKIQDLEESKEQTEKTVSKLHGNISQLQEKLDTTAKKVTEKMNAWNLIKDKVSALQASVTGFGGDDNNGGGLNGQILSTEEKLSATESSMQRLSFEIDGLRQDVSSLKERMQREEGHTKQQEQQMVVLTKELNQVNEELEKMANKVCSALDIHIGGQGAAKSALQHRDKQSSQQMQVEQKLNEAKRSQQAKQAQLGGRLQFHYSSGPGLNDDSVKGVFANLISINDQGNSYALEVVAGGRLYQIVVDNKATGNQLLDQRRVRKESQITLIPLQQIQSKNISRDVLELAKELVGDKVDTAINLVNFDPSVRAAAEFVFGSTFVCADTMTAERITFHPQIRTRSVTKQGDVMDPQGTITGGSKPKNSGILTNLHEMQSDKETVYKLTQVMDSLQQKMNNLDSIDQMQGQADNKKMQIEQLTQRLQQSSYQRGKAKIEELEKLIFIKNEELSALQVEKQRYSSHLQSLHTMQQDLQSGGKSAKTKMTKELQHLQNQSASLHDETDSLQSMVERLEMEKATKDQDQKNQQKEVASMEEQKRMLLTEIDLLVTDLNNAEDQAVEKLEKVKEAKAEHNAQSKRLDALNHERTSQQQNIVQYESDQKGLSGSLKKTQADKEAAVRSRKALVKAHAWLISEEERLLEGGGDLGLTTTLAETEAELARTRQEEQELGRTIDRKVQGVFEQTEREFHELQRKKETIERDKAKIEGVIAQLDKKKKEALEEAHVKVTESFHAIFSTVLPGCGARLKKHMNSQGVIVGLEMVVSFGGLEKDSLSELSGGQRSLLALSLILALLRFKPAPMYILDEVDAALDLSHTQNIGIMLKKYFPQSQFIVVSLKEGMFNNANVLFRTKFVDGVSTITCTKNIQE